MNKIVISTCISVMSATAFADEPSKEAIDAAKMAIEARISSAKTAASAGDRTEVLERLVEFQKNLSKDEKYLKRAAWDLQCVALSKRDTPERTLEVGIAELRKAYKHLARPISPRQLIAIDSFDSKADERVLDLPWPFNIFWPPWDNEDDAKKRIANDLNRMAKATESRELRDQLLELRELVKSDAKVGQLYLSNVRVHGVPGSKHTIESSLRFEQQIFSDRFDTDRDTFEKIRALRMGSPLTKEEQKKSENVEDATARPLKEGSRSD